VGKRQSKQESAATEQEYREFAERFTDAVLDPRQPWLVQYVFVHGFPPVPTKEQINSGALAAKMWQAMDADSLIEEWLYNAIEAHDRKTLIAWFAEEAKAKELTKDELCRVLACANFKQLKKSLKELAEPFKFRPGPSPPTERQYGEALRRAESLHPVLLHLLHEQSRQTANTLPEILNYLAKDFPDASTFLLHNLSLVEACLRDQHLLGKAKTRAQARARVLADAIAGAVHLARKPSTAFEYLRTHRRKLRKYSR